MAPGVAGFVARTAAQAARIGSVIVADGLLIRPTPADASCCTATPATRSSAIRRRRRRRFWARDGLYVVATHSGVTLAPALAELVAAEVTGG